jgi:hypothetical protein
MPEKYPCQSTGSYSPSYHKSLFTQNKNCGPGKSKYPAGAERIKARAVQDPKNIRLIDFFRIYYKKLRQAAEKHPSVAARGG